MSREPDRIWTLRNGWLIRRAGRVAFGHTFVRLKDGTGRYRYTEGVVVRQNKRETIWVDVPGWNPLRRDRDFFFFARMAISQAQGFRASTRILWAIFLGALKQDRREEVLRILRALGYTFTGH